MLSLTFNELAEIIREKKLPAFRAQQLWTWLHVRRVGDFNLMSNLPAALRARFSAEYAITNLSTIKHLIAADQLTEKWLLQTKDTKIETALIREIRGKRRTVCVSCMSGCPVGCTFCATGQSKFTRHLTADEIIEQVYLVDQRCHEFDGAGLTNVVFMGMGEPLLNFSAVLRAAEILTHNDGFNLSKRHLTISTIGIPEKIIELANTAPSYRLAFSLHAPEQKLREQLIPLAKNYPLPAIISALKFFAEKTSRRLTIEYCLIDGVNSAPAQAKQLKKLLRGLPVQINLIPLNPTPNCSYQTPSANTIRKFQNELRDLPTTLREEKGRDINAACGQLRNE